MINVASWAVRYGDLDHSTLVDAGLADGDVTDRALLDNPISSETFGRSDKSKIPAAAISAAAVLDSAWSKAGLSPARNRLDGRGHRVRHADTALVVGSSLALADEACHFVDTPRQRLSPYSLSKIRGNALTAPLAIRFGLGAGSHTVSAASATGGHALVSAAQLIRSGQASRVAVVCLDQMRHEAIRGGLGATGASSASYPSLPLSAERSGMRPATAAVAMILEADDSCRSRGHAGLARWLGGCLRHDCHHLMAPLPSGKALIEASNAALGQAQIAIESIDWVSLHATGTRVWDQLEIDVVRQLFGCQLPHLSAFKRTFGHTMGAAGLLEAGIVCEGLFQRRLPPWPEPTDPTLGLLPSSRQATHATHAMMWSAGMGGDVVANIFAALP